jgi:hypothetical protein
MYLSDEIKIELNYFKRLHEHDSILLKGKQSLIKDVDDDEILYMLASASYAMDIFDDGFFESFVITDKALTGKPEFLLDAYAFIETELTKERHLHLFQYKSYDNDKHSASPVEVNKFASNMNDFFVHPELRADPEIHNSVFKEIDDLINKFIKGRNVNKIKVKCHFITNAYGINKKDKKIFTDLLGKFEYDKQNHGFDIQVYGNKEIFDLITNGKIEVAKEIIEILMDSQPDSYRLEDNKKKEGLGLPNRVLIGICNVNELIRLQNKYHHNQLYSENIRLYIGERAAVNKDIIKTITSEESQWFPYMNNGISIICDKLEIGKAKIKKGIIPIELTNLQIINGCQTVNALYSAKYNEDTRDKFKPSNILIKIYQTTNLQFKRNVISATNNQNAVKTFSFFANDQIQIKIQDNLKQFDFIYDRKGESRKDTSKKVVTMVQGALAFKAVFEQRGQELRGKMGQSRVFQAEEYSRIYKDEYLEDLDQLNVLSVKILTGSLILNKIKDLINEHSIKYLRKLPIINKSTYYLSGLYYALYKQKCETFIKNCTKLLKEDNPMKSKNSKIIPNFIDQIAADFEELVRKYQVFYTNLKSDKTDIDNLLKSKEFGDQYNIFINNSSFAPI